MKLLQSIKTNKMENIFILPTDKPSRLIQSPNDILILLIELVENNEYNLNKNIYITSDEELPKKGDWCITISISTGQTFIERYKWSSYNHRSKKIILTTNQDLIKDGVQAIDDAFLEWFIHNPSCDKVEIIKELNLNGKNGLDRARLIYKIIIPKEVDWSDLENSGLDKPFQLIEEPKQELSVRLQNSLKQFNLTLEDAINTEPHRLKQIGFGNRSIIELQGLKPKQETLDNARREYVSDINCGFYSEQIVDTIKAFSSDAFEQGYKFAQEQNKELFSKEEVLEQLNLLYSMKNSLVDTFTDKNDYITMKWFEQFK